MRCCSRSSRRAQGEAALSEYGIEPVNVGIAGVGLPQQTTAQVFNYMKSAREKIANEATSEGSSRGGQDPLAGGIRREEDQRVRRTTSPRASAPRASIEAAKFLGQMKEDPQLAVFIQNMEFIRMASDAR